MSSITIILILFIHIIHSNQCEILTAVDLQSATYHHSFILRVQASNSSANLLRRKVFIREIIKIPLDNQDQIHINDMIIIGINSDLYGIIDHSCWHFFRQVNVDLILFLNETTSNEFDLRYPPVESTYRVRENIDAVLNYGTYSPQVIIKTRIAKAVLTYPYSIQCNARGNPLPRLFWSKLNQTSSYYPSIKQCQTSCRIYSIQNKYQSILYFRSLTPSDQGIYVCHAENPINHTMISISIDIDQANRNLTCASLKYCHHRGQCLLLLANQLKCLCDNRYIGEQCETNYDEIIEKQNNLILLFKSRFLAGCILFLICFILILLTFLSCLLTRKKFSRFKPRIMKDRNEQILSSAMVQIKPNRTNDDGHRTNPFIRSLATPNRNTSIC